MLARPLCALGGPGNARPPLPSRPINPGASGMGPGIFLGVYPWGQAACYTGGTCAAWWSGVRWRCRPGSRPSLPAAWRVHTRGVPPKVHPQRLFGHVCPVDGFPKCVACALWAAPPEYRSPRKGRGANVPPLRAAQVGTDRGLRAHIPHTNERVFPQDCLAVVLIMHFLGDVKL